MITVRVLKSNSPNLSRARSFEGYVERDGRWYLLTCETLKDRSRKFSLKKAASNVEFGNLRQETVTGQIEEEFDDLLGKYLDREKADAEILKRAQPAYGTPVSEQVSMAMLARTFGRKHHRRGQAAM